MLRNDLACSEGLLQTDIGLIAVNKTHAVFSLRIERAKLTENHFFLNVISDIAGGDDTLKLPPIQPTPTRPSRRRKAFWTSASVLTAVIGIYLLPVAYKAAEADTHDSQQPLKFISSELLTPKVQAGGELMTTVVEQRMRVCPTMVHRALIRESDGAAVDSAIIPALSDDVLSEPVTLKIAARMPKHMKPGYYIYRTSLVSDCGSRYFTVRRPDMRFEIEDESGVYGSN